MAKRITKISLLLIVFVLFVSAFAFAQPCDRGTYSFGEPMDNTTDGQKVENFINALKRGDTTAFRLVTYDVLAGKSKNYGEGRLYDNVTLINWDQDLDILAAEIGQLAGVSRTPNVIDTVRMIAYMNEVTFMEYLCDGDVSDNSETRKNIITATLQGLYNLDPRVRLIAIHWLRRLRPDGVMFRDVERAVEYETVASSYEKYRPKNIDIPSIDEPGAPGVNVPFIYEDDNDSVTKEYNYNPDEESIKYPFDEFDAEENTMTKPEEKIDVADETGYVNPLTDGRPTATQLDARKWGNGNPFDPDRREREINMYIDVMTQAGALRRFRNTSDGYLLGYQYRLGSYFREDYNGMVNRVSSSDVNDYTDDDYTNQEIRDEIRNSMVPIGHGDKYFYRNIFGRDVIGNSWAELIKLREFIVRAIWYDKIVNLELNSLVIISKDTFKTLYLSIDGESAARIPFLSAGVRQAVTEPSGGADLYSTSSDTTLGPRAPMLDERHIPVLIQGLLKNPVFSTRWVIARALKDIYLHEDTTLENKKRINFALKQAKYDALAKDVISGAILHEELITVGKINVSEPNYATVNMDPDERYPASDSSGTYAGGVYIPRKNYIEREEGPKVITIEGFAIPNDEVVAKRYAELSYTDNYDWYEERRQAQRPQIDLIDRVMDSFTYYTYGIEDDDQDWFDGDGQPMPAYDIPSRVELTGSGFTENTAPVITYYNNRNEYWEAKAAYYKWNYKPDGVDYRPEVRGNANQPKYEEVVPHFNVEHYNRVVDFINAVVAGNNEIMATVTWDVVESAELLTLYRIWQQVESARASGETNFHAARRILFGVDNANDRRESRITFFDALQTSTRARVEGVRRLDVERDEGTSKPNELAQNELGNTGYYGNYSGGNFRINELVYGYDNIFDREMLSDISERIELFRSSNNYEPSVQRDFSAARRQAFVSASLAGLYNKDPRVRLTAIHWLRRLGPSEEMKDEVRKARGILRQEEYSLEENFDDPFRTDRPDTTINRVEFLDTNIYHREDNPDIDDDLISQVFNGSQAETDEEIKSIVHIVSKDFQTFVYKRLGLDDYAENITFYDMKPGYSSANPSLDPEHDQSRANPGFADFDDYDVEYDQAEQDLLQLVAIANPLYTEDRYEFYFRSYGLYQFKSPSEELEKLYRLILREEYVNRIKSGREADIFVTMPRLIFKVLADRIDYEYVLRIPMASFFGLDPLFDNLDEGCYNVRNGYYDASELFQLPKGPAVELDKSYAKYPIFKESQIALIKQGVDNPNFNVQKGTAEFLIRFYNFYSNLVGEVRQEIRDAMFFYKQDDIVIEEITLAFERENPDGRAIIKAGSRLGNDLNTGGIRNYKNLPVELRKDIRRTINNQQENFDTEVANILGVRRASAIGENEKLGYYTEEGQYVPVKPGDDNEVPGEEIEGSTEDDE